MRVKVQKYNGRLLGCCVTIPPEMMETLLKFKDGGHRKLEFVRIRNVGGVYISMPAPGVVVVPNVKYANDGGDLKALWMMEMI